MYTCKNKLGEGWGQWIQQGGEKPIPLFLITNQFSQISCYFYHLNIKKGWGFFWTPIPTPTPLLRNNDLINSFLREIYLIYYTQLIDLPIKNHRRLYK